MTTVEDAGSAEGTGPAEASRDAARPVPELRFDAGCLALNLVATLGGRHGTPVERLDGPGRLREWCEGVGLPVPGAAQDAEPGAAPDPVPGAFGLLADLRLLREAAYDVAASDLRGAAPSLASVALVNECAHHAPPAPRLELATAPNAGQDAGQDAGEDAPPGAARRILVVRRPALTGRQFLSLPARDLLALMADPQLRSRLRECEAPQCRMLYLDATAGGRRRWCSMRVCGNRAKAARHRGRSATATP